MNLYILDRCKLFCIFCLFVFGLSFPTFSRADSSDQVNGEKVILKVFELPDPKATDAFSKADRAVIRAFKQRYPQIELRSFSGLRIENMDLDTGPLMAIAGGVSPDILYVNFRQSDTYIQNDFLYPLDEYVKKQSEKDLKLRVADPVWPVINRKKMGQNSKKIWALPYETVVRVLMYRKDLFRKVGLNPSDPPDNWRELVDYCRRLTIPAEGTYGMYLPSGPQAAYGWIPFLWSAGGRAVRQKTGTDEWAASFEGKSAVEAMQLYLELITTKWKDARGNKQEGFVIREGDVGKLWDEGKIGMQLGYMNQKSLGGQLDPNLYGVAPLPAGPSGRRASEINCRMMGIFSGAGKSNNSGLGERDPQKVRDAAWKYIWFYDSEIARKIRLQVMIEEGFGRMQNPLYLKRYGYEEYLQYTPPNWLETFSTTIEQGQPEPYGRNCQKVYEYMTYPLDDCISLERKGEFSKDKLRKEEEIGAIFSKAVKRANVEMIGKISPEERKKRNNIAILVALFLFISFSVALYKVWKIFTPSNRPKAKIRQKKKYHWAYLMLIPALGSILLWKYIPMLMGSLIAFQDYHIVGQSDWIGLENFANVLFDPVWWSSLSKTLYYMFLTLSLGFIPPIILAILLQEVSHGKLIYRILYYLPAVISGIIVIYLWKLMYDPSDAGALNQILMFFGLEKLRWIHDETLAMLCCVIPTIWAGIGPGCLIYLAALKGIPEENYEAADIDGANFFHKIRYIVLPHMKALIIIQFIAAFIVASQQSGFILVMTFGGPNEATKVSGLLIFEKAYLYLKFGMATTMAWLLGLMMIGFTVIQLKRLSKMEFKTVDTK